MYVCMYVCSARPGVRVEKLSIADSAFEKAGLEATLVQFEELVVRVVTSADSCVCYVWYYTFTFMDCTSRMRKERERDGIQEERNLDLC